MKNRQSGSFYHGFQGACHRALKKPIPAFSTTDFTERIPSRHQLTGSPFSLNRKMKNGWTVRFT
ncbi:MAG: hypothetical protein WCJ14_11620, partial [Verrucomicrobiota bacterium]